MLASYLQMVGCSSQSYPNQKLLTAMQLETPLAVIEKNCGCLGSPPHLQDRAPCDDDADDDVLVMGSPPLQSAATSRWRGSLRPQGTRWIRWERHQHRVVGAGMQTVRGFSYCKQIRGTRRPSVCRPFRQEFLDVFWWHATVLQLNITRMCSYIQTQAYIH
jgi:hypothetical protein